MYGANDFVQNKSEKKRQIQILHGIKTPRLQKFIHPRYRERINLSEARAAPSPDLRY